MNDKRYAIMFLRLGILASVLFAVFWGVWHLSGYQVPAYTNLKFTENISQTIHLSRWWDIPFAFLLVNIYAWILRVYYKFGLKFAQKDDLGVGLSVGLGLFVGLGVGLVVSLVVSLVASLGAGLIVSLFVGLGAGLVVSLFVGLGIGLVACVIFLIKVLCSSNFWKAIYNWFGAKDIA